MTRKEALAELIAKVEAGEIYETMGHTIMCQRAFPKPKDFDGSREAYSNSDAQQAILAWRNGSLDAAKALHGAVVPEQSIRIERRVGGWVVWLDNPHQGISDNPARAWLLAILRALHSMEPDT